MVLDQHTTNKLDLHDCCAGSASWQRSEACLPTGWPQHSSLLRALSQPALLGQTRQACLSFPCLFRSEPGLAGARRQPWVCMGCAGRRSTGAACQYWLQAELACCVRSCTRACRLLTQRLFVRSAWKPHILQILGSLAWHAPDGASLLHQACTAGAATALALLRPWKRSTGDAWQSCCALQTMQACSLLYCVLCVPLG